MKKAFARFGVMTLGLIWVACSYAQTRSANPIVTVSLDIIEECSPEKLTRYALLQEEYCEEIGEFYYVPVEGNVRDKLALLKKDKIVKIIFSTKITTGAGNTAIVDNTRPIEYFNYSIYNVGTAEFPEWALTKEALYKYEGNFCKVMPTITEKGEIDCAVDYWMGRLADKAKIISAKEFKKGYKKLKVGSWPREEELYWPIISERKTLGSRHLLKDGETIVCGSGFFETSRMDKNGKIIKGKEKKVGLIFIGADINKVPLCPGE